MVKFVMHIVFYVFFSMFCACSGVEHAKKEQCKKSNERKDRIHRLSHEMHYVLDKPIRQENMLYPWEGGYIGGYPSITQEDFRCKGGGGAAVHDCEGGKIHSLPLRDQKEFIYPILLDLLNYVQKKTRLPVVITCGHSCPLHHAYSDASEYNKYSKHMMGAEVDFYVRGMESRPMDVIHLLMQYYRETACYRGQKAYETFAPLDFVTFNVSTTPWYNKEILIKLYREEEGRDRDNQHPYPYISIQVRFDRSRQRQVTFSQTDTVCHTHIK